MRQRASPSPLKHGEISLRAFFPSRQDNSSSPSPDYAGRIISRHAAWLCSKLAKDEGHTAYVGWIAETLLNPIEVWERVDNGIEKRHYYSAYSASGISGVVYYLAVAATLDGSLVTAFQKDSAKAIDERREGTPVYCCY